MRNSRLTFLFVATGAMIISLVAFASNPPKNKISMDKAEQIATAAQPGVIESKELEHEHGKWVYSFDIRGSDKMIHEIQVDAKNGKIVSQKIETQAQEAAEVASEKKKH